MIETYGLNIFDQINRADAICITTNCTVDQDGINPMGALAGQAARRWNQLPFIYGKLLALVPNVPVVLGWVSKDNNSVFVSGLSQSTRNMEAEKWCGIVAYPTMVEIGAPADLDLVVRSAELLVEMSHLFGWKLIYTGSPGTGVGGLNIDVVHDSLRKIFDDRFTVMIK